MNVRASAATPASAHSWDKVEKSASYFLLFVLLTVLVMRLSFSGVWSVPTLDFVLSSIALVLVLVSFWLGRNSRTWRLAVIVIAGATQLVPMVVREPVLLFPLLGALIPVSILVGCLVALSHKGTNSHPQPRS